MGFPPSYDPAEAEPRLQAAWSDAGLYHFNPADTRPIFAVDTPPPTVSGEIHLGHVYSYIQAEAMIRFWRMQGRNVFYPFGFDDNGLPTERFVERSRGIRARDVGRAAFVQACLETSAEVEARFEQFWQRLGISADWRQRYSSISPLARRTSQWSFLDLYRKGRIYRDQAPNPWCVECETAVAQAELEDAERETIFYTLAFQLARDEGPKTKDEEGTAQLSAHAPADHAPSSFVIRPSSSLEIATTRPELLPACVAIFVHPDDGRFRALIGREAIVPLFGRRVPILADASVDPDKGSGAVMCCTFGDATDVQWWRDHRLPLIPLITRQGRLSEDGGAYAGLTIAEAKARILADLREAGHLLGQRPARQSIRIHERCGTPLEILETRQWFVRVLDAKDELLALGRGLQWRPAHMQARYESWVHGLAYDWCISRQRYYGVPFPAWHCASCSATILADESQLPVDPLSDGPPRQCDCGSSDLRPDEDVMDTWATSSMSPQVAAKMLDDPALYGRLFPMQLRPQAHDIIRTWAFYTIAKSYFHFGSLPWETVMISGHALDPSGRKLSKSKGNAAVTPMALIERHSADAVRYWACRAALGADQPLAEDTMRQGRRLATKLWNAARFCASRMQHAESGMQNTEHIAAPEIGPQPQEGESLGRILHSAFCIPTDRWLLSTLQRAIAEATACWKAYDYAGGLEIAERFFWGTFCDQYLELAKGRLYDGAEEERASAQATIALAFEAILKLLAPVMPHITEELYGLLFPGRGSLHTAPWPEPGQALHDPDAEAAGAAILAIAGAVRRHKTGQGRSLGSPLAGLAIACASPALRASLERAAIDLRSVSRARELAFAEEPGARAAELAPGLWLLIEGDEQRNS
jgi:valyl-tRNA synthetase